MAPQVQEQANPYAPPQAAPGRADPAAEPQLSGLAIAGFVMSLLPFCMINLVGLVLGAVAWAQINSRPRELRGKGLAVAAVVIGSLWLVIAVVGVLAAIAIPSFLGYESRARQSEAKNNLRAIYTAESAHFAEHGSYADSFEALEWRPSGGGRRYTYFLGEDVLPPPGEPAAALPFDVATFANRDGFQAAAVGNIDGDPTLDVWVIGDDGWTDHVVDDGME
jgi:type IV pilus assembly protein PilA